MKLVKVKQEPDLDICFFLGGGEKKKKKKNKI